MQSPDLLAETHSLTWRVGAGHLAWRIAACVGLATAALTGDYVTGPAVQFPILFVLPSLLAAWLGLRALALVLAFTLPLGRLWFESMWRVNETLSEEATNAAIQTCVLLLLVVLTARVARRDQELQREIVQLRGILPTCMHCKRIRDEGDHWVGIEEYVSARSEARFSHGLCPDCARQHYSEWLHNGAGT